MTIPNIRSLDQGPGTYVSWQNKAHLEIGEITPFKYLTSYNLPAVNTPNTRAWGSKPFEDFYIFFSK